MLPFFVYSTFARLRAAAASINANTGEPSEGFAENQILHLICALVGVERFAIRKEPRGVVVGDNAVAAEQLARPGDGLAALGHAERLGKGRVGVRQLAFGVQLC